MAENLALEVHSPRSLIDAFEAGGDIREPIIEVVEEADEYTVEFKSVSVWLQDIEKGNETTIRLLIDFFVIPSDNLEQAAIYVLRCDCKSLRMELETKVYEAFQGGEKHLKISDGSTGFEFNFKITADVKDKILGKIDQYRRITDCAAVR